MTLLSNELGFIPILERPLTQKLLGDVSYNPYISICNLLYASRVNILIGKNNSGKSYFIKSLVRNQSTFDEEQMRINVEKIIVDYKEFLLRLLLGYSVDYLEFNTTTKLYWTAQDLSRVQQLAPEEFVSAISSISSSHDFGSYITAICVGIENHTNRQNWNQVTLYWDKSEENNLKLVHEITRKARAIAEYCGQIQSLFTWSNLQHANSIYIPVIRTLRNYAEEISKSSFIHQRNIQELGNKHAVIVDGQDLFDIIYRHSNSSLKNKRKVEAYEEFLQKYFFDQKSIKLISNIEEGKDFQKNQVRIVIDEEERFLDEMGDGIQQIIILTYPLFFYEGGIIVIEEPELNLEPKIQKRIMQILTGHENAQNFVFFISTHSNNIVDTSIVDPAQISLYTINKLRKGDISDEHLSNEFPYYSITKVPSLPPETLRELGVKPSSMLMTNGIIWVEGPSDIVYIDALLQAYQIKTFGELRFIRGIHYEFMMYGGSLLRFYGNSTKDKVQNDSLRSLSELVTMFKINPNYFVVFDSDMVNGVDTSSFAQSKIEIYNNLEQDKRWFDTEIRTIEDYFPSSGSKQKSSSKTNRAIHTSRTLLEQARGGNFKWADYPRSLKKNITNLYTSIDQWNS